MAGITSFRCKFPVCYKHRKGYSFKLLVSGLDGPLYQSPQILACSQPPGTHWRTPSWVHMVSPRLENHWVMFKFGELLQMGVQVSLLSYGNVMDTFPEFKRQEA